MKFTEEQFKKLVEIQEEQYSDDLYSEPRSCNKAVEHVVEKNNPELNDFIDKNYLGNEAVALMNPLTRELAHNQFVEEEKKYVWTSERKTGDVFMRLYKSKRGYIGSTLVIENGETDLYEKLTETEIREWGYNPEMFNKEEVE